MDNNHVDDFGDNEDFGLGGSALAQRSCGALTTALAF